MGNVRKFCFESDLIEFNFSEILDLKPIQLGHLGSDLLREYHLCISKLSQLKLASSCMSGGCCTLWSFWVADWLVLILALSRLYLVVHYNCAPSILMNLSSIFVEG